MRRLLIGAIAGFAATAPMSAVIGLGRLLRLLWTPPPKQITSTAVERVGVDPDESSEEFTAGWLAAHFLYGAAAGALYSLARPALPGSIAQKGLIFGGAVWGVSYLGFIPALGLYPWPQDDSRTRMAVMIAAHAVYGVATAQLEQALAHIDEAPECYVTIQPPERLTIYQA
jgi:hypothetical protein